MFSLHDGISAKKATSAIAERLEVFEAALNAQQRIEALIDAKSTIAKNSAAWEKATREFNDQRAQLASAKKTLITLQDTRAQKLAIWSSFGVDLPDDFLGTPKVCEKDQGNHWLDGKWQIYDDGEWRTSFEVSGMELKLLRDEGGSGCKTSVSKISYADDGTATIRSTEICPTPTGQGTEQTHIEFLFEKKSRNEAISYLCAEVTWIYPNRKVETGPEGYCEGKSDPILSGGSRPEFYKGTLRRVP